MWLRQDLSPPRLRPGDTVGNRYCGVPTGGGGVYYQAHSRCLLEHGTGSVASVLLLSLVHDLLHVGVHGLSPICPALRRLHLTFHP